MLRVQSGEPTLSREKTAGEQTTADRNSILQNVEWIAGYSLASSTLRIIGKSQEQNAGEQSLQIQIEQ